MALNPLTITLTRDLRRSVRAAITAHPDWNTYRAANLGDMNAADMARSDLIHAANALGIDIAAVAALPITLGSPAPMPAPSPLLAVRDVAPAPVAGSFEGADATALVSDALAPVRDMLGSKVLAALEASISPLALAAVKPARTVETVKTVTVTVDETGAPVAPVAPAVAPVTLTGERVANEVFSPLKSRAKAQSSGRMGLLNIPVCSGIAGEGDVPAWDASFAWNPELLGYLCLVAHLANSPDGAKRKRASMLMYGPAGTGKTTAAETFAAACGRPFYRIAIDRTTEPLELIGQRLPSAKGGTVFHEGALVAAMQVPFAVILIDEPSFLRPGSAAVLQTILDRRYVVLKEDSNRRVDCAPGVMFLAADNTNLTGDETGRYADTNSQNLALQDRFAFSVSVSYMSAALEARTLSAQSGIALAAAERLVGFASLTRNGAVNGNLTTGTSYRRLLAWADALFAGVLSKDAFLTTIMNPCDPADRETMRTLEKNNADHTAIDALASGAAPESLPVHGATVTPGGAAAADVFGDVPDLN